MNNHSEEYVQSQIEKLNAWNAQYGSQLPELYHAFEEILQSSNTSNLISFYDTLKCLPDMGKILQDETMLYIYISLFILKHEYANKENCQFYLADVHSIDELICHHNEMRFLVMNIENKIEYETSLHTILELLTSHRLSYTALSILIQCTAINIQQIQGLLNQAISYEISEEKASFFMNCI